MNCVSKEAVGIFEAVTGCLGHTQWQYQRMYWLFIIDVGEFWENFATNRHDP